MRQPYQLFIALRYLRARASDGFISFISAVSMIGIGLAVAVLIVVLSVMNGFETELEQRTLAMVSHAAISGYAGPIDDWREAADRALERGDVTAVAPYVEGQGMAMAGTEMAGVTIRGIDPAAERQVSEVASLMTAGSIDALAAGEYRIVLGVSLARTLGVSVGDQVLLVLAEARVTPAGLLPTLRRFTVAGIFDAGMYEYDRLLVFVHLEDAARLFRTAGRPTGLRCETAGRHPRGARTRAAGRTRTCPRRRSRPP